MSTAFVAGATGYTGRAVVQQLAARAVDVVAHVRPDSSALQAWTEHFQAVGAKVDATAWEQAAMEATMARLQPSWVFSLLGTTRARARRGGMSGSDAYDRVDYGLTALLLRAVKAGAPRARFVYLSAIGADRGKSRYMQARRRAEQDIMESGVAYTIARPSFISGPDRDESRPLERAGAVVSDGMLQLAGVLGARKLRDRYHSTSGEALATALVDVALDPDTQNVILESEALHPR